MEITKIVSCDVRHPEWYNPGEVKQLGIILFSAATLCWKVPTLDVLMTCCKEKVDAALGEEKDYQILYALGSSSTAGHFEIRHKKTGYDMVIFARWGGESGPLEVTISRPFWRVVKAIRREHVLKMKVKIDGRSFSGENLAEALQAFFPE